MLLRGSTEEGDLSSNLSIGVVNRVYVHVHSVVEQIVQERARDGGGALSNDSVRLARRGRESYRLNYGTGLTCRSVMEVRRNEG